MKERLAPFFLLILLLIVSTKTLASPAASCTLDGSWHHKAAGSSQSCLSYVCCSNGDKTNWVAGTPQGAEDWCKSWKADATPDDSCNEESPEVFSKMTLIQMARLTYQAQEGDDEDDDEEVANQPPPPQVQCRYERECNGE